MAQKILELVEWLDRWFFRKVNVNHAHSFDFGFDQETKEIYLEFDNE